MRILLITIFGVLFAISSASANSDAVIAVHAAPQDGARLVMTQYRPGVSVDTVQIARSNEGLFVVRIRPNTKEYALRLGNDYYLGQIFLSPNDSIVVQFEHGKPAEIVYDRIGANRLFQDSSRAWLHNDDPFFYHMGNDEWPSFQTYLRNIKQHLNTAAGMMQARYPEHAHVATWLRYHGIEKYWYGSFNYITMHYWDTADKALVKDLPSLDILDSVPWSSPEIYQNSEVWSIVGTWMNDAIGRSSHDVKYGTKEYVQKVFDIVNALPESVRFYALSNAMSYAEGGDITISYPIVESSYDRFFASTNDTSFNAPLRTKLEKLKSKLPGRVAPPFTLPDSTGKMFSRAQFRGKLIYLDFWGSWCMPCLKELPALQSLEEKFGGDTSIVFISIGLEASSQVGEWRAMLKYRELKGLQLLANDQFRNPVAQAYAIDFVPTFMLIAPDGTFINASAPRPSDPAAEQAIRGALKEATHP